MDAETVGFISALFIALIFWGLVMTLVIFFLKKLKTKIRDHRRHKEWKAAADRAAAEESTED